MTPALYIRTHIFKVQTQQEWADLLGKSQPTVCRWETGECDIGKDARQRIREIAKDRNIRFDAAWFFEVPQAVRRAS